MASKKAKKAPSNAVASGSSTVNADKQAIRADKYLRLMMKIGIPLALISVASLWLARTSSSDGLELLFMITCPPALMIGFAYNIRYVSLAVRRQRQQQKDNNKP